MTGIFSSRGDFFVSDLQSCESREKQLGIKLPTLISSRAALGRHFFAANLGHLGKSRSANLCVWLLTGNEISNITKTKKEQNDIVKCQFKNNVVYEICNPRVKKSTFRILRSRSKFSNKSHSSSESVTDQLSSAIASMFICSIVSVSSSLSDDMILATTSLIQK